MSEATPAPTGRALTAGWATAVVQGGLALLVMAAAGQAIALLGYLAGVVRPLGSVPQVGWFYFGAFHRVPLVVTAGDVRVGGSLGDALSGLDAAPSGSASVSLSVAIAFGLATGVAAWLLVRAGRLVAEEAGGGPMARALHGLKVAPVYALPAFLLSLLVSVRAALPTDLVSADVTVRLSAGWTLALTLLLAGAAGAAGGILSARERVREREPWGRRGLAAAAGGARMFLLGLALSIVGFVVLLMVQPDLGRAYVSTITGQGASRGAVVLGHQVLLLPNQGMWTLVPAMGGCDGVSGDVSAPFLCYGKYPRASEPISVPEVGAVPGLGSVPVPGRPGTAPPVVFLFLLVPLVSVFFGGRLAARRGANGSVRESVLLGAGAGIAFSLLVLAGAAWSQVSLGLRADLGALFEGGGGVRVGPYALTGALLALVWGSLGGAAGGWWEAMVGDRSEAGVDGDLRAAGRDQQDGEEDQAEPHPAEHDAGDGEPPPLLGTS